MTGDIMLKGAPTANLHPATKLYVDSAVSGVPVADLTPYLKKDGTVAMTGTLNLGTNKIQNLTTGTLTTDSVNLGYVQGEVSSL